MRALLAALLFAGCGPGLPAIYTTACGMVFNGMTDGSPVPLYWSALAIQGIEDATVKEFQEVTGDARFQYTCQRLNGVHLFVYPQASYQSGGISVDGTTHCEFSGANIIIGNNGYPRKSSLPHEIAHAVQDCDLGRPWHEGWNENGIFSAIGRVQAR